MKRQTIDQTIPTKKNGSASNADLFPKEVKGEEPGRVVDIKIVDNRSIGFLSKQKKSFFLFLFYHVTYF